MKLFLNAIKLMLLFVFIVCASNNIYGQLSKVHYIPPIGSGTEVGDQYLYISTPSTGYINVTIKPIGGSRVDWQTKSIKNDNPWVFPVYGGVIGGLNSALVKELDTYSNSIVKDGYIIESSDVTYVSFRINSQLNNNNRQYHSGAYVSKGEAALGTRFRPSHFIGGIGYGQDGSSSNAESFVSILATENDTRVQLSEVPAGLSIKGYTGSFPIVKDLNEGETWVLGVTINSVDIDPLNAVQVSGFTGTLITSDDANGTGVQKPIVVVSGSIEGSVLKDKTLGNRDYGFDQIVETEKVGHEYIVVKGLGDDLTENVYVIADSDNTSVYLGNDTSAIVLNKGEFITFDHQDYDPVNNNMYITTKDPTKKLFVYQTTGYSSVANQALVFVPPLSCSSKGNIDNIPFIDKIGNKFFTGGSLTIVTKDNAELKVYKDGLLFADNSGSGSAPIDLGSIEKSVTGKSGYVTYLLESNSINALTGRISVFSNEELYVASTTYGDAASSGSYYSGFVSDPILRSNLSVSTLGNCIQSSGSSNTILTTSSAYDTYRWLKFDPIGETYDPAPGISNLNVYEPNSPGKYKLIGKLSCFPGITYESEVIVVSICPDDTDQDGVPDTIDLDRDNDGISNNIESYGNGLIDFSDPATPSISLPDDPANAILSTGSTIPTSAAVSGNSNGEIISIIPLSGLNEKTTYEFNPILPSNEAINIRVSEVAGSTASEFETFTIIVYPPDKNITVLDPGERLLIDDGTGFKRVLSEGISGNQLKFKYNPMPLSADPFELLGVDIKGIDVIHELSASAISNATLKVQVEIVDYERNTDALFLGGDLVVDSLDDDSDADDCPDKTESGLEGLLPPPPFTFINGTVDARGRIILTGSTSPNYPDPKRNASGDFLFLTPGTPITINTADEPQDDLISEGDTATFTIGTTADNYQWQMDGINITDSSVFSGTTTQTLTVNTTDTSLNGNKFSVLVHSNTYLCETPSAEATLSVLALPPIPVLNRVYSFCGAETVAELKDLIDPTKTFNVYDEETGGVPLSDSAPLVNEDYYVTEVNAAGGESVIRSFTNVVVTNPTLSTGTPTNEICLGESVTLTANDVPYTFYEFEDSLDATFEYITSFTDPISSDISYYFLKKESMSWTAARNLIKSLGSGASMYVINSKAEEIHVFNEMSSYTGTSDDHFWLGLRQIDILANGKFDEGWVWLDGRPLTTADANWYNYPISEPNDYDYTKPDGSGRAPGDPSDYDSIEDGSENYAQFDYAGSVTRMEWNDMANDGGSGNSWPIFEFQGVTQVKWYKKEPGKVEEEIIGETSNTLTITPTVTGNITYFYKIDVNGIPCGDSITITVNPLPEPLLASPMELCDNNLDGDPNTNEASFDLDDQRKVILSGIADRDVFFYETNTKALSVSDSISTATLYTSKPKDISYRVVNKTTGCFGADADINSFALIVNDLPPILSILDLRECDDTSVGTDKDGLREFDLTQKDAEIYAALGGNPTDYKISYHTTLINSENGVKIDTSIPFENTEPNEQLIFVRIEDNKGCIRYDNSFKVIVDKLPVLKTTSITLEQCESDGELKYDLNNAAPRFSDNYENEYFEFFEDPALTVGIPNPESFTTSVNKNVFLKIRNKESGCVRSNDITINLIIGTDIPPSTFSTLSIDPYCFDASTSTTPGYGAFDPSVFEDMATALIAKYTDYGAPSIEISFFESEEDASYQRNKIATYGNGVLDRSTPYTTISTNYDSVTHTYSQEIWAGIEDLSVSRVECKGRLKVADLTITPEITFDVPPDFVFCRNEISDTISIQNPIPDIPYTYTWTRNGSLISGETSKDLPIYDGGTYVVFATNPFTGCDSTPKEIEVFTSEIAIFTPEDIIVYDLTGDGSNRIEIKTSTLGDGDYAFKLNDSPYQDSPLFENVPPGIHTVYVNDKNDCGEVYLDISVIGYSFYFTPNGDGVNDTWQILGVNATFQSSSLIYIFDRHGRLMAQLSAEGNGWDGTYNGTPLPADDYWFRTKLEDGRSFTGHFSLIR